MRKHISLEAFWQAVPDDARFTPCSVGYLERMVKLLQEHYRQRTTDECQTALACLYGHRSWDRLTAATHDGTPSRLDDEESREVVEARFRHQYRSLLALLGGVTEEPTPAPDFLDEETLAPAKDSIVKRYDPAYHRKRGERARRMYELAYAREVLLVVRPTGRDRLAIPADDNTVELSLHVQLLPRALDAWLAHHRPHLAAQARCATGLRVRQHAQSDLLTFSLRWGELCVAHGPEIPRPLQVYPIALCAKWFAWNACVDASRLAGGWEVPDVCAAWGWKTRGAAVDPLLESQRAFMLAQPREDICRLSPSAREQQIRAGFVLVKRHMQDTGTFAATGFFSRPAWPRGTRAAAH